MRSVIPAGLNGFSSARLLPFAALHHLINFLFDGFKIERGRLLHRRIIDLRLRQLEEFLLHERSARTREHRNRLCNRRPLPGARHPGRMPFGAITLELIGNLAQPPSTP